MSRFALKKLLSSYESNLTAVISTSDSLRKVKFTAETFSDTAVATHCVVAKHLDFFIRATLFLPCFYQWAVMEIDIEIVICAA